MVTDQHIDLTLEQLADEVAYLLEYYNLLGAHSDSRVSPTPDARTIRYYTTLGLIDRPRMEGRQARYGKQHLLQLLAIKALQSHGYPLSEIQSRIFGRHESELEAMLGALADSREKKTEAVPEAQIWREYAIAPGLKLVVEDGWMPWESVEVIKSRIEAVLEQLKNAQ